MESIIEMPSWNAQYKAQRGIRWWPNEELVRYIGSAFADIPKSDRSGIHVLDVGCGTGANSRLLIEEGFSVTAIDAAEEAINIATEFLDQVVRDNRQSVSTLEHSILNLPSTWTNYFNGIVDVQTIQHTTLTQHLQVYQELYAALKPGGFFFSVHMHEGHWDYKYGHGKPIDDYTVDNIHHLDALFPNNGIVCFLPGHVMKNILERSGFVVESIEQLMRTYRQRTREARYLVTVAVKE